MAAETPILIYAWLTGEEENGMVRAKIRAPEFGPDKPGPVEYVWLDPSEFRVVDEDHRPSREAP